MQPESSGRGGLPLSRVLGVTVVTPCGERQGSLHGWGHPIYLILVGRQDFDGTFPPIREEIKPPKPPLSSSCHGLLAVGPVRPGWWVSGASGNRGFERGHDQIGREFVTLLKLPIELGSCSPRPDPRGDRERGSCATEPCRRDAISDLDAHRDAARAASAETLCAEDIVSHRLGSTQDRAAVPLCERHGQRIDTESPPCRE